MRRLLFTIATVAAMVTDASAQPICLSTHLNNLSGIFSSVGHDVAIDGGTAIVGAHNSWPARAFVFDHLPERGWLESQVLFQPDGALSEDFGHVVAVEDDIIAIASWNWDKDATNGGSVFVFRKVDAANWIFEQKIFLADGPTENISFGFGRTVVIDQGRIAVGASGGFLTSGGGGITHGRVYIYEHDGASWIRTHTIAKDEHPTLFGSSLAMRGDRLIAGSYLDNTACDSDPDWSGDCIACASGIAFIFRYDSDRNEWIEEAALLPENVKCDDAFGWAVGIDGNSAIVSAYSNPFEPPPRRVYLYEFDEGSSTWNEIAEIPQPDVPATTNFGRSVDLVGPTALVGSGSGGAICSSAFVFQRITSGQWTQRAVLTPEWTSGCNSFGRSVALGGTWAILGASTQSPGGAAYIYDMQPPIGDLTCDETVGVNDLLELLASWGACPAPGSGTTGCPADLNGDGTVGVADLLILLANWG